MKFSHLFGAVAFIAAAPLALAQVPPGAENDSRMAASEIADIVEGMEHFPSDDEKETLMQISERDAYSEEVRRIAEAVHDFQHSAQPDDAEALNEIAGRDDAADYEKTLAEVVANMEHMPSEEDVRRLSEID